MVSTLLHSQKPATNHSYNRVWAKFCDFASSMCFDPAAPTVHQVLDFLQKGLEMHLSQSTLKGQVSAISAFTGRRLALHPLVVQIIRAVIRVCPPLMALFPKWDLSLVLDFLASSQFGDVSLMYLTLKTAFLIAITSGHRVSEIGALGV